MTGVGQTGREPSSSWWARRRVGRWWGVRRAGHCRISSSSSGASPDGSALTLRGWGSQCREAEEARRRPWTSCSHQSRSICAPVGCVSTSLSLLSAASCATESSATCGKTHLVDLAKKVLLGQLAVHLEGLLLLLVQLLWAWSVLKIRQNICKPMWSVHDRKDRQVSDGGRVTSGHVPRGRPCSVVMSACVDDVIALTAQGMAVANVPFCEGSSWMAIATAMRDARRGCDAE